MRCAQVERLADAYVDDRLDAATSGLLEEHASSCSRCAETIGLARAVRQALLSETLSSARTVKAPSGFADRVMAEVYRQALRGASEAATAEEAPGSRPTRAAARVYRRLGFSFVVTAGILAVSLLVPRIAYPTLLRDSGTRIARGGDTVVREVLTGADEAVRGALGEQTRGGDSR